MKRVITYLQPLIFRRGSYAIVGVEKTTYGDYLLNTWSGLRPMNDGKEVYTGTEDEYVCKTGSAISKRFYNDFIVESKRNHKKYKLPNKE